MAEDGMVKELRRMPAEQFVRRMAAFAGRNDIHYAFWIGAGCSISAGIPGASSLVSDRWLPQIRKLHGVADDEFEQWVQNIFPGYDPANPAAMYGPVMEELFIQPEARQREVEALCDGRFPGFGYAVLAALLAREDGLFNVALTTNFDDLIADAMYVFTEARPLVIPDESLAAYIRPTRLRPLVIKVHGDHRLSPRNTRTETEELKEGISEGIANLLHDRGVVFVGYGGNDRGIAKLLEALPSQALPLGVWWVSDSEPEGPLCDWLYERQAIWVESPGFDELMLLFQDRFEIPHPTSSKFDRLFGGYLETYRELEKRVGKIPDSDPRASSLKDATARADASATDWSAVLLQATRIQEDQPDLAEDLYKDGIREYPRAILLRIAYGDLLLWRGRYENALAVAGEASNIDPENEQLLRIQAHGAANCRLFSEALDFFAQRVELIPQSVAAHADYAVSLAMNGRTEEAEHQLEEALQQQPTTYVDFGLVALALDELGEHDRAESFHLRALENREDYSNFRSNYVRCLIALGRPDEARSQLERVFDLTPDAMGPVWVEALFYRFVLGDESDQTRALGELSRYIGEGARSPAWNLDWVVEYGEAAEISDSEWLESLAAVINGNEEPELLNAWPRWRDLQPPA